jgi:hypothetical protein
MHYNGASDSLKHSKVIQDNAKGKRVCPTRAGDLQYIHPYIAKVHDRQILDELASTGERSSAIINLTTQYHNTNPSLTLKMFYYSNISGYL